MQKQALEQIENMAIKKKGLLKNSVPEYIVRAIMASFFVGIGVMVSFKTGQIFYDTHSSLAYPLSALGFSIAILLISYAGGELFTGNTFYFTYATLRKKVSWKDTLSVWGVSYAGNIIGAIIFAIIIFISGVFHGAESHSFLTAVVEKKISASFLALFFKGLLCNWMVCLAFFIPLTVKEDIAKIVVMIFLVYGFFITGFEHSIANMSLFAISLLHEHTELITLGRVIHNLVPVTLGNIVGGAFLLGVVYYYLEGRRENK